MTSTNTDAAREAAENAWNTIEAFGWSIVWKAPTRSKMSHDYW